MRRTGLHDEPDEEFEPTTLVTSRVCVRVPPLTSTNGVRRGWKMSTPSRSAIILGTLLATRLVGAESGALWLEPSKQWYIIHPLGDSYDLTMAATVLIVS